MSIKIMHEDDLLQTEVRKKLIESWDGESNSYRKDEAFKGYECLKDKTINYVLDLLLKQFDVATVQEMQYAMSNISILRKVIDKLAKVYANGVRREMPNMGDTKKIEAIAEYLALDSVMAKADKYYRTFKNCLIYVKPLKQEDGCYDITLEVKPPFHYDVVPCYENPKLPMAVVLSDYVPARKTMSYIGNVSMAGRTAGSVGVVDHSADHSLAKDDHRQFIWWTKSYHFTTNAKGELVSTNAEADGTNPIGEIPFVNLCGEQDGQFFAEGGQDLIDTAIKINCMITNVKHVGISQGFGQLYMTGKNLPKSVKVGPNHCIQMEYEEGEPTPTVGYLNSNPPLTELQNLVEMEAALMLSTNNLSTSGVSTSMKGGKDFASGISMMIDKSESIEDIEQQSKIFIKAEPAVFAKVSKWYDALKASGELCEAWIKLSMPKDVSKVNPKFNSPKTIISESDQIDVFQKRIDLGISSMVDIVIRDNPGLTEEEAQAKLEKIQAEKQSKMESAMGGMINAGRDKGQASGGQSGADGVGTGPNEQSQPPGNDKKQNQP